MSTELGRTPDRSANLPEDTGPARQAKLSAGLANANRFLVQGQADSAIECCQTLLKAYPDNADVLRYLGLGYLQKLRLPEAENVLGQALRLATDSPDLLNDLGIVRLKQNAYEEALGLFSRALDVDAMHSDALGNIAILFTELKQPDRAQPYLERLASLLPFSGTAHAKAANNSLELGNVENAIRLGRKAVRNSPCLAMARLSLANALETSGRFRQAKFQYLSVLRREPRQVGALAKLLSLRRTDIDIRHVRDAHELLDSRELQPSDRVQLHLALARYYDCRRRHDLAFEHLKCGNSITWRKQPFDSNLFGQAVDSILNIFTTEFLHNLPAHEASSSKPIFIVGMPRSGTTLVEQILASHSQVEAGGELSTITNLAFEVSKSGEPYPWGMKKLDGIALGTMATRYLSRLDAISRDAPRVTDKMPFNFMHLGLVVALFPNAKIIHCSRGPLDTCLSCYFTSFGEDLRFASDLEALGRYYLDYRRMMDHWRAVLPKPFLDVGYEQLVSDTEQTIRMMLGWCELDWEPACMQFYQTERGIRTPSRWQVRQPIYAHSVGRWRDYEKHLQPLLKVLAPVLQ